MKHANHPLSPAAQRAAANRGEAFPCMLYKYQNGGKEMHGVLKPNGQTIEGFHEYDSALTWAKNFNIRNGLLPKLAA